MKAFDETIDKNDEYYTPRYAVFPIVKYLKTNATVWCPFDLECSNFVQILKSRGFNVIHSHLSEGKDFFTYPPPKCDYIVSNPPYAEKTRVLKRLYEIGKPFAMLIGCLGIFEAERFDYFKRYGVEIMVFDTRICYFTDYNNKCNSVMTQPPFSSWYICHNVLPSQIVFEHLKRHKVDVTEDVQQKELFDL